MHVFIDFPILKRKKNNNNNDNTYAYCILNTIIINCSNTHYFE